MVYLLSYNTVSFDVKGVAGGLKLKSVAGKIVCEGTE
jgi:hypothetical protein